MLSVRALTSWSDMPEKNRHQERETGNRDLARVYPSTTYLISSDDSSSPSRLRWIRSTVACMILSVASLCY